MLILAMLNGVIVVLMVVAAWRAPSESEQSRRGEEAHSRKRRNLLMVTLAVGSVSIMTFISMQTRKMSVDDSREKDTVIPKRITAILDEAIVDGVVSDESAIQLNNWLNSSVRAVSRDIETIALRVEVAEPVNSLRKIVGGTILDESDKVEIACWLSQVPQDTLPKSVRGVIAAAILETSKARERDVLILDRWLGRRESGRRLSGPNSSYFELDSPRDPSVFHAVPAPAAHEAPPANGGPAPAPAPPAEPEA
ncbi:hypothetical protein Mal52_30120 [Symmachiella dynata]|uniref:Uncharacterized protein n=1 Tax=Symmachiella dynata TaxID=2527995 RepID=A0A517ZPW1_9PLAN|nr:hypothetical protein [Symmachiella dynata]QDU44529.1 hypothetical protein Mal52_30120 [Symmachiella dynata]